MPDTISRAQISNELYDALPDEVRLQLEGLKTHRRVPTGSLLIERGVSPESVIFVESGKVEITVPGEDKSLHLAVAGPGKVFGLRAVVAEGPPEITVRCMEECGIAEVSRELFLNVVRDNPRAYVAIAKVLSSDLLMAENLRRRLRARSNREHISG